MARKRSVGSTAPSRRVGGQPRVPAIVLAAGASSRMGRPKLTLTIDGKTLLAHTLAAVRTSSVSEVVVVLGADADRLLPSVPTEGVRIVVNSAYREGMSGSIRLGLRNAATSADAYLIVLGDEPFVSAKTMDRLIDTWRTGGPQAIIPTFRGRRGHPILVDRRLAPRIETVTGDTGYRILFQTTGVLEVPVEDPGILVDLDTPEDVEALSRALESGRSLAEALTDYVEEHEDRLG